MTKAHGKYLMSQVSEHCSHIRKVRRKHIVFESNFWALEAYRFIWHNYESAGMEMLGGSQIVYFPWKRK